MAAKKTTSRARTTTRRAKKTATTEVAEQSTVIESVERPSHYTVGHYLEAAGPQPPDGTPHPGKWLVFVSRSRIDALWQNVERAVRAGRLGHRAAVTTALPHPSAPDPKKHVVFVYTRDANDPADVRRVREALRQLGVTWKIPYKSGGPTGAGEHDVTAGGPATKYYE